MRGREVVFQLHWLLGISAGVVLALVGATGAVLSAEEALLERLNPGVFAVPARGEPLAPAALVARVLAQRPGASIQALTLARDPGKPAQVAFAPPAGAAAAGRARGERRHVDPYTGTLLATPRGEKFFRTTMELHRWLAAGAAGKQVVGASTVALVFFCLSGLYLRWPRRRWRSPRAWLLLDVRQRGRAFLWQLHAVVGTWVLLAYLVMALSGLWWSYGWYREGLQALAGVEPAASSPGPAAPAPAGQAPAQFDPDRAWRTFMAAAPGWGVATLAWPRPGEGASLRYLDSDAPHERAWNTVLLSSDGASVASHGRYRDRPLAQRVVGSMFAVHRGSFFGGAGVWVFALASLLMPLFAATGWMLYLQRRALHHRRARPRDATLPAAVP